MTDTSLPPEDEHVEPVSNIDPTEGTDTLDPSSTQPSSTGGPSPEAVGQTGPPQTDPSPTPEPSPSTPEPVEPSSNIDPNPEATAAAAIDEAATHPTVTNTGPDPLTGTPMPPDVRAWLEANGSRVWVVADPA